MNRKSFLKTLIGGVPALPFVGEVSSKPHIENAAQEIVDKPEGLTYYSGEMCCVSEDGKLYTLKQEKNGTFVFKETGKTF